jgi:hypothetical protein
LRRRYYDRLALAARNANLGVVFAAKNSASKPASRDNELGETRGASEKFGVSIEKH